MGWQEWRDSDDWGVGLYSSMAVDRSRPQEGRSSVRIYRLGEEPRDDLSATTTAEERLRILSDLSLRAWSLSGRPLPTYSRSQAPVRIQPLR